MFLGNGIILRFWYFDMQDVCNTLNIFHWLVIILESKTSTKALTLLYKNNIYSQAFYMHYIKHTCEYVLMYYIKWNKKFCSLIYRIVPSEVSRKENLTYNRNYNLYNTIENAVPSFSSSFRYLLYNNNKF